MKTYTIPAGQRVSVLPNGFSTWQLSDNLTTKDVTFTDAETEVIYVLEPDREPLKYNQRLDRRYGLTSHPSDKLIFLLPDDVLRDTGIVKIRVSRSQVQVGELVV